MVPNYNEEHKTMLANEIFLGEWVLRESSLLFSRTKPSFTFRILCMISWNVTIN